MYLRSVSLKGFKSFPERTKLDFASGVSVIVGPNGSGKSNITDAVLWALGAQSPLSVRGQSMQDVIFAGAKDRPARDLAEVEIVLDNSDGAFNAEFSELSIARRLERSGEGEYRLNGARCRLVDVAEALSDTGLGREMHSVVSQGEVEQIVGSRASERRAILEEAAGLSKHRKRRHRAELKLRRTAENLSRALDVEAQARSRLRPLKRQAEAAELSARLERQSLEAKLTLARDESASARAGLAELEGQASSARSERDAARRELEQVQASRQAAEAQVAARSRAREELQNHLFSARSAAERIAMRAERARDIERAGREGHERRADELQALERTRADETTETEATQRVQALETELAQIDARYTERLQRRLSDLQKQRGDAERRVSFLDRAARAAREALDAADRACKDARKQRREAQRKLEGARTRAASVGAELAAINQYLRTAGGAPSGHVSLSDLLEVTPGYELAVAAALDTLFGSVVCESLESAQRLCDRAKDEGATAVLVGAGEAKPATGTAPAQARPLSGFVSAGSQARAVIERILDGVWLTDSLEDLPPSFRGVAVTRSGRLFDARLGVVRQVPAGGVDELFAKRNRRAELIEQSQAAAEEEARLDTEAQATEAAIGERDAERERADEARRAQARQLADANEQLTATERQIDRATEGSAEDPESLRRAQVEAELSAERRLVERQAEDRDRRSERAAELTARIERDRTLEAEAARAGETLERACETVEAQRAQLEQRLDADEAAGSEGTEGLRRLAKRESELQASMSQASEKVTDAEVAAQRARDGAAEVSARVSRLAEQLSSCASAEVSGDEPQRSLTADERSALEAKIERLDRRREQLGPLNPLAKDEYEEAKSHLADLERQRADLEQAMAELRRVIRDADREIRQAFEETFQAASANFADVVSHLFPGGSGRLRMIENDSTEESDGEMAASSDGRDPAESVGVEVEVNPAGKAMRRMSLLSGGEKSLVALAFLFGVFLARPSPFYILDEVEAALDDVNIDRFLQLVHGYADRAQFIIVTHQKRTMAAADRLYGVSMGSEGVSKVLSRKLEAAQASGSLSPAVASEVKAATL